MQPELIETFLDLIETRSFNRTAERLGITQSTVSARVAALEKKIDRKLFNRSRAGTELTTAGLRFEPHARDLRHAWTEALRSTRGAGDNALSIRMGLQMDLAGPQVGRWVTSFQTLLPETAFYIELDNSVQMCSDLQAGHMDFAVMFSPRPIPDLYFESIGEVRYLLVSSHSPSRADVTASSYIRGEFSPAFDKQHQKLFPELSTPTLSCGHSSSMSKLLLAVGGAGFVLEEVARDLVTNNGFHIVEKAPAILQTIYAASHLRYRHTRATRRLISVARNNLM